MKKIRSWCDGGRRPVRPAEVKGKHARCEVCGQRFIPRETPGPDGEPVLHVPPHKAY